MEDIVHSSKHRRLSSISSSSSGFWGRISYKRSQDGFSCIEEEITPEQQQVVVDGKRTESHLVSRKRGSESMRSESEYSQSMPMRYHSVNKLTAYDFLQPIGPDRNRLQQIHSRGMIGEARRLARMILRRKDKNDEADRERDSLDALDFDLRSDPGFRYPLLERLDPKSLKKFKKELEEAEQMRQEMNIVREADRLFLRPEPRMLIKRRHWAVVTDELKKLNPRINHFLDASYEDVEQWLIQATVPVPNNRPMLLRINESLSKAWSESYFFGLPKSLLCIPTETSVTTTSYETGIHDENNQEETGQGWNLSEDLKRRSATGLNAKKLSTTSSVTIFSTSSTRNPIYESLAEEEEEEATRED